MLTDKITIKELEDHLMHITPLFGIPLFKDILRIHVNESYVRVMMHLLKHSIQVFNRRSPLYLNRSIYVKGRYYTFKDNFQLLLDDQIDENAVELVPLTVVNYDGTLLGSYRSFTYDRPTIDFKASTSGMVNISYIANRPYRLIKCDVEDEFTDDSAIYGIELYANLESEAFVKEVQYNILKYMLELKTQVNPNELPIDTWGGLQDKFNNLNDELEQFYTSSTHFYHKLWR